jgi:NAD(P)-dependent dehydrogenase (short-subunit alcohol dehydrogenase family)
MGERVVVVTGATAGLGRAVAHAFAQRGDALALLARDGEGLDTTAKELADLGVRSLPLSVDVADWPAVRHAARRVEDELGPIDIWVNNAMTSVFAPFVDIDVEDFERATRVNYFGFVHGTKAALIHMIPRDRGTIVQVSSALAYRSIPLQSAYCGSKHAILGLTESLRTELLHDHRGVRVTMVHMPAMNTPQFDWVRSVLPHRARPVAPIYQPEVGARAVCFAADHPRRRGYYVGASTALTVLGNKVAPALLDRYLARTGYDAQQSDEVEDPDRPDNLDHPVTGHHCAHGRFDATSHNRSLQLWLTTHRAAGAATLAGGAALLTGSALRRRRR